MKKLTVLFLSLVMMAGLAACSGGTPSSGETSAPESSASQTSEEMTESGEASSAQEESAESSGSESGGTLVVYFSATGNTERVAEVIAEATGGELFELEPVDPYTSEDLNYSDDNSRVSKEYADESLRDVELAADTVDNWQDIEIIYLGYPVWWGIAAWPVNTFVEANDFTGKTVIPFCTSASSGLGESAELLAELAGAGDWQEGMRFRSSVSDEDVAAWVESLEQ